MTTHLDQPDGLPALTDGQLLQRFVANRDETAFATLVARHAAMVWGVCCRVLRDYHDAEDAFQATFVVLSRKAASVVPRERLANWLFGVARNTALKVRRSRKSIQRRELAVGDLSRHPAPGSGPWDEFYAFVYEELDRLSDRHRSVVILCDLEGKTRKEAARELGVPEGSVAGWLNRARKLLARRLARYGGIPMGMAMGTLLSREVLAGYELQAPPAVLAINQSHVACGPGIPSTVSQLAERVVTMIFLEKLQTAAATFVLATVVLVGGVAVIQSSQAETTTANEARHEPVAERAKQATTVPEQETIPATVKDVLASFATVHTKKIVQGREINGLAVAIAIDERGILLTANHVIADVTSVTVEFPNQKQVEARVLAFNRKHDLALLQVAERLPGVKFGDSSTVRVGDPVQAIHSTGKSTSGRVTALARRVEVNEWQSYENLIQNDAALSPGDSGGPLIDGQGRMIGVNIAIRAGRERIAFALPINDVIPVIEALLKSANMEKATIYR